MLFPYEKLQADPENFLMMSDCFRIMNEIFCECFIEILFSFCSFCSLDKFLLKVVQVNNGITLIYHRFAEISTVYR